jgi:hypothetical protein
LHRYIPESPFELFQLYQVSSLHLQIHCHINRQQCTYYSEQNRTAGYSLKGLNTHIFHDQSKRYLIQLRVYINNIKDIDTCILNICIYAYMHIYIYGYEQILEGSEYSPPSATRVNDIRTTYVWEKKDMIWL